ncbi:MAG TPA: histidine phosphatase family protein [Candidatus Limnocylindrales bacterium]|nr:histidine phosphatase family protein [Candidatus Limnocylindrales bacterium]
MLTLHLARHGETDAAARGYYAGDIDPPLIEAGIEQARRLAASVATLGLDALYVSPKLRARMTMEPIEQATGLTAEIEPGLKEIGYGRWEGVSEAEARSMDPQLHAAWTADPAMTSPPGGETAFDIVSRAMPVIQRIRERHPHGHVLVVSHKATIRVLTCALLGLYVGRFRDRIACPTSSVTTFAFGPRGPMLMRHADVAHLGVGRRAGG